MPCILYTDMTSLSELLTVFGPDCCPQSGEFGESVPFVMHDGVEIVWWSSTVNGIFPVLFEIEFGICVCLCLCLSVNGLCVYWMEVVDIWNMMIKLLLINVWIVSLIFTQNIFCINYMLSSRCYRQSAQTRRENLLTWWDSRTCSHHLFKIFLL